MRSILRYTLWVALLSWSVSSLGWAAIPGADKPGAFTEREYRRAP
jgi:hypothetical protein